MIKPELILSTCKALKLQSDEPKILLCGQEGSEELGQADVAGLVDMKVVLVPDSPGGFPIGTEQNGGEIDKGEELILFAVGSDLAVELLIGFPFAHSLG